MTPALCASDVSAVLKRRPTDTMREIYYTVPSIINFYDDNYKYNKISQITVSTNTLEK